MKYASLAAVVALVATPGLAGGLNEPVIEPVPVAAAPVYVGPDWTGAYAGAQLGYGWVDADGTDGDGILGGIHGGYLYDFGQFVAGAELDYDWADVELDNNAGTLDNVARLKLIGGVEAGPALIYATAGVARAEAEVGGNNLQDNGYFGGLGMAYPVTQSVTVGAEVLRHEFDDFDNSGLDVSATTATARVSFRF